MSYRELIKDGDRYYQELVAVGWIDEWSEEETVLLHESLQSVDDEEREYMVFTLSDFQLDPEGFVAPKDYFNLISELIEYFGIEIAPSAVSVEADGDKFTITAATPEGDAVWEFTQEDEWLHEEFFNFFNDELLLAFGEERIIYPLPPADSVIELVFQYPEVIDNALEKGLIPDDDFFVEN